MVNKQCYQIKSKRLKLEALDSSPSVVSASGLTSQRCDSPKTFRWGQTGYPKPPLHETERSSLRKFAADDIDAQQTCNICAVGAADRAVT